MPNGDREIDEVEVQEQDSQMGMGTPEEVEEDAGAMDLAKYLSGLMKNGEEEADDLSGLMELLGGLNGQEGGDGLATLMLQGAQLQEALQNGNYGGVIQGLPAIIRSVRESAKLLDPTAQELVNSVAALAAWVQKQYVRLADERKDLTREIARVDAEKKRAKYEALKNAGFTPKQSMDLLLTEMATSAAAQNQALAILGQQMNAISIETPTVSRRGSRRKATIVEEDE